VINLIWDEIFKRRYRKLIKNNPTLKALFWEKMELFVKNPHHPQLKTIKLSGKLNDCWSASIGHDYRIIFQYLDDDVILLIVFGSHDEVY
jgi:addiction module RelE/StbE family toxin